MRKLEYKDKKGYKPIVISTATTFFVLGYAIAYAIYRGDNFAGFIFIFLMACFALFMKSWSTTMMLEEWKGLAALEASNLEITKEERARIEKGMIADEKRLEKELKIEEKKLKQLEIEERRNTRTVIIKDDDSLEKTFDVQALSILNPIIKQAKKDNRKVTGQELLMSILRGVK